MTTQYIKKDDEVTYYYKDGVMTIRHRDDGPAVIDHIDGYEAWYLDGKKHRLDGPATYVCLDGKNIENWYVHGKQYTRREFLKLTQQMGITLSMD